MTKVPCFGGYARVLTKVNEIKAQKNNTLFLNAGDEAQGTLFYSFYGFQRIGQVLNRLGFDLFTVSDTAYPLLSGRRALTPACRLVIFPPMQLGNHEFDGGDEPLGTTPFSLPPFVCRLYSTD